MADYTDSKIDLVLNKVTKEQYDKLVLSGLIEDTQLYLVQGDESSSVSKINAGSNITVSPSTGVGEVTISANVPTKTSQLTNDSTFISSAQLTAYELTSDLTSNYYKKTDTTLNSSGVLKIGSTQITALTAHQSLTAYETKSDLTSNYPKDSQLSLYYNSSNNTMNLKVKDSSISAALPDSSNVTIRTWSE